ncbi:GH13553 [Drosophila grimshawi]|uniref:GH13553 n=2 Tax=Drosophila grimshawi TaxID=7222 RepID=B4JPN7_DROGR|nr:GH13553 [Drosophila grimshawi]
MDKVWTDKACYNKAEKLYQEWLCKGTQSNNCSLLVTEIAKAREDIQSSLEKIDDITFEPCSNSGILSRLAILEAENKEIKELYQAILKKITLIENNNNTTSSAASVQKVETSNGNNNAAAADDDDDDVDLFASDSEEEDAEKQRIREERLSKYNEKKSTKTAIIAKSSILLDVKPWDDEADLKAMEAKIREIQWDGLLWGASKFVPVAFGIQKITISCVVEDEKVSVDWLTEEIEKIEDLVQSVDIAAFNKI